MTKLCNTHHIYLRGTITTVKVLPSLSYLIYCRDGLLFISDLRGTTCLLLALLVLIWFSLQWRPSGCSSGFLRIKFSHAAVQEKEYFVKSNEHGKREHRYGCSPQEMDVIFLFDFGCEL